MSTDHSSSMPPFDMGSNSIDINMPPVSTSASMVNAGIQPLGSAGSPVGEYVDSPATHSPSEFDSMQSGPTTTMPGPRVDAVEFRVIRPGVPVRRLRLTGNRYTFGSAEGCSIRLNDATLRPMHAVLIRDANRVLVRAYSVPLEINGNRVTETSLQIGDVMRMGAYRFELLSGIDPSAKLASAIDSVASSVNAAEPIDHQSWHSRLQREASQWRLRQSEVDLRENRCIERETELRARESEMWSRADQLHRRESQLMSQETAALQIQEEYIARKEELARLREESSVQRRLLDERQDQIRNMESEYQHQVDNATRQLELSQQQAESATEAVQRMREQFASLNDQLERLTHQQNALEINDHSHVEQHRQLQRELESARDEAIDSRAESEARRQNAEDRVAELNTEIESLRSADSEKSDLAVEHDSLVSELRQQIDELEERVQQATEEASSLREDYEGACASIRQLELLVDQTTTERDEARSGLEIESDALRQSVQQLTHDLGCANVELNDLRVANDSLSSDLNETRQQRDEAIDEVESRPSSEAFEALSSELDTVKTRLEQMQRDYDETMARVDSYSQDSEPSQNVVDSDTNSGEESAATAMQNVLATVKDDSPASDSVHSSELLDDITADSSESDESSEEEDKEAWPTYQLPSDIDQDVAEVTDVENADVTNGHRENEDAHQDEVASDSVNEVIRSANPCEADEANNEAESTDAAENLGTQESDNQWRSDAQQSPESAGHLNAWDSAESAEDYQAESMESADDDIADDVDEAMWQTESPEVAVDEAIAEIEHSVDQAIADIERPTGELQSEQTTEGENLPEASSNEEASVSEDMVADDVTAADEQQHAALNPWSQDSASEVDESDSETDVSPYQNIWQSENDPAENDSTKNPSAEDDSDNEVATQESVEDSTGGYQPIDPWSQLTPQDEPAEESAGSLADMLIRDMDEEREQDAATGIANEHAETSTENDDEVNNDSVESTFVMDSAAPDLDDDETGHSPWDLQHPENVNADQEDSVDTTSELTEDTFGTADTEPTTDSSDAPESEVAEDDDSIEAYMNRLLKRVQTGPDGEDVESENVTQSITMSGHTAVMESTDGSATTEIAPEPIDHDAPLVPRSQAPERSRNMSAMRDLANQSARSAVARSVRVQARDTQVKAFYQFLGALTGIGCGLLCLYFRDALGMMISLFFCGFGLVVAAIYAHAGIGLMNEANSRIKSADAGENPYADAQSDSADVVALDDEADAPAKDSDDSGSMAQSDDKTKL